MSLSKAQIEQFFESPVWREIEERTETELKSVDSLVENPDPFTHGKAVGNRAALRLQLRWKEILLTECSGDGVYGSKTRV